MMIPTATAITTTTMAERQHQNTTASAITLLDAAAVTMNKYSNENNSNTNHCTICNGSNSNDSNAIMNSDGSNSMNNNNNYTNNETTTTTTTTKGNQHQYYVILQSCSVLFEFILSYAVTTATTTKATTTTCTNGTSSKEQSIDLWSNNVVTTASSTTTTISGVHPNQTSNSNCRCSVSSSSAAASWPPPTLIGLAMLTIMAFIVHPDGYTWIVIRKMRDVMFLLAKSFSVCWTMAVNDYGSIISTLLALSTFAALFFVCYILHETLKSRTNQRRLHQQHNNPNKRSEKHGGKRRKRKNTHHATRVVVVPTNPKGKLSGVINDCDSNANGTLDTAIISQETDVAQTQLIQQQQHVLPPLAEDEPLESPPATEPLLCVSLWNQQSHHSAPSPRSRTASSSTADSILCSSVDDQSSCCSGRSTPTPISANECANLSFETTTTTTTLSQNKMLPTITSTEPNNNTNHSVRSTPNRTMNPNSRRSQNGRHRNGKKNSPYHADNNETTVTNNTYAITTPPRPTPSKRWDALKPSNRVGNSNSSSNNSNNNNQQYFNNSRHQHQHHRHHQGYQRTKNNNISSSVPVAPTSFSHENASNRKQSSKEELMIATAVSPNTFTADLEVTEVTMSNIAAIGNYDVARHHTSNDIILDVPHTTACIDHHDTLFRSSESTSNEAPPASGLNPNSPVWTGTYNVVQQHIGAPLSHGSSPLTLGVSGMSSASSYLDYNASNFPSASSSTNDSPMRSINVSHLYATSEPYQPSQSHYFNGPSSYNHSNEIFQDPEPTDYSFIRSLQEDTHYNNNEHDTVPSVYSSMLPPSSTLTTTSSSSTISSSYHRTSQQQHAIVRENPFANNSHYDDIDDDQIEAELLELGGQMVGSILDF